VCQVGINKRIILRCTANQISSTELFGYFTPIGVHQLCEQRLYMAMTYPTLCIVFSWCRKQQVASLQISVNLEFLGQVTVCPFKRRKELWTERGRKRHRMEKKTKDETSVIWCHSVMRFCSSFNLLKPTSNFMYQKVYNITNFYIVITWDLCVLYGSRNKQQILP
jgi:hypothetical protein